MIMREWRCGLNPSRLGEYERLETESLHMWTRQPGFLAVLFSRTSPTTAVILSFWDSQTASDKLKSSTMYEAFMKKLSDSGILEGTPTEESMEAKGGYLPSGVDHKFYGGTKSNISIPAGLVDAHKANEQDSGSF
jgi:heme-degrading monooxygenase HmoA